MGEDLKIKDEAELIQWIQNNAKGMSFLLAYADDGVFWGRLESGTLVRSPGEKVALTPETLQRAYLFGETAQLTIYKKVENEFAISRVTDEGISLDNWIEEKYFLWGTGAPVSEKDVFTPMVEGRQGLKHTVPTPIKKDERAALVVRHYIQYDDAHQAYISHSRLVKVTEV